MDKLVLSAKQLFSAVGLSMRVPADWGTTELSCPTQSVRHRSSNGANGIHMLSVTNIATTVGKSHFSQHARTTSSGWDVNQSYSGHS